jgi:uncharacterized protein (DUF486 family)
MTLSPNQNLAILVVGLIFYGILNTLASFSFKLLIPLGKSIEYIFIIEFIFGIFAYLTKIPLYLFFSGQNSVNTLHVMNVTIYSIIVELYSRFYLNYKVRHHTTIILILIIGLSILNEYLNRITK